ncbi:MAG: FMN-binding glutamate synthase family protein [Acidobacteriota bacterium]
MSLATLLGLCLLALLVGAVVVLLILDLSQRSNAIQHNYPVVGRFRFLLSALGPKLRQYIVAANDEERPFSRDQRHWIRASADRKNNYFGFGSDNDMERSPNYLILRHSSFPLPDLHPGTPGYDSSYPLPGAKVLGQSRGRQKAFRPASLVNISAMSYGSLSSTAVSAMNRGAKIAGVLHNTGEGGVAPYHLEGGDLIWQLGTGYFGCRTESGDFSLQHLVDTVQANPTIRALEVKLSQGAKPGVGGILPAEKITAEISRIRGIPRGKDCLSPNAHTAFSNADELLDFVETLADATGLPVGIKSAVGELDLFHDLAREMEDGQRGIDFLTVDGGEGGTGAGPLAFTDHVALPFQLAFTRVYKIFHQAGLSDRITFIGSGKLGLPERAMLAFAIGCDMIQVAREAMLAIGCIQAQRCHQGNCPAGIATHRPWLVKGLDPQVKAHALANYFVVLRKELTRLSRACGVAHPALLTADRLEILDDRFGSITAAELFGYSPGMGLPSEDDAELLAALPLSTAAESSHPASAA